nr:enoyl-CoA hydratase/isomerase family protein [Rhodococcus sp. (in: high G+C Gram-positive bacteria)]
MTEVADASTATDAAAEPVVEFEITNQVAYVTMRSRPHNFLGIALFEELIGAMHRAQAEGARAVVLRSGLRNFCAGADIALFESHERGVAPDIDVNRLLEAFEELPLPIVAAVKGVCVGGGFEIALACDMIIAAESAKIGAVEATLGINPLMGAMQRIAQRAGSARAKEMALLARRYDPHTLERWNIINRVVPDDDLESETRSLAEELATGPTLAHASSKAIIKVALDQGTAAADAAMVELQADLWRSNDLTEALTSLQLSGPGKARFQGN